MDIHIPIWICYWALYSFGLGLLSEFIWGRYHTNDWIFLGILLLGLVLSLLRCHFIKEDDKKENINGR